jgi:orotidine-5'-phosphate decarboxylase
MYEQYGIEGLRAYIKTANYAKEKGLIVIGDIKRGDISSTAVAYSGHLGGVQIGNQILDPWNEDWITVNPYFGTDGIKPFVEKCKETKKGIFVLVKTSNPSGKEIQDLQTGNAKVYERVAHHVCQWGREVIGTFGYSRVAAVVGATHKEEGDELRKMMPGVFFLVPGYGAQGGTAEFVRGFFDRDRRGVLVNSSRGIIGAYKNRRFNWSQFGEAALEATIVMRNDLRKVIE